MPAYSAAHCITRFSSHRDSDHSKILRQWFPGLGTYPTLTLAVTDSKFRLLKHGPIYWVYMSMVKASSSRNLPKNTASTTTTDDIFL